MKRRQLSIKEASALYEVSRTKLHRLVQGGKLHASKDPRDERVTLLRTEELDDLFQSPAEEGTDMTYDRRTAIAANGIVTDDWMARIDAIRARIGGGKRFTTDSAAIIREQRKERSQQVYEAVVDGYEESGLAGQEA